MRLSTAVTFALTVLLLTSSVGAVAAAAADTAPQRAPPAADRSPTEPSPSTQELHPSSTSYSLQSSQSDRADQVIRINVSENGNAHWTIEHRFLLTDDDVEAFREWADAVTAGERDVRYDRQWFERHANEAEAATGRPMAIQNAGWDDPQVKRLEDDEIPEEFEDEENVSVGTVSYSVTWTNFARVDGDRIYFGDVFRTADPLPALWDGQRLVIVKPPNYALETPSTLRWDGPYEFSEGELEIVFVRSGGLILGMSGWVIAAVSVLVLLVAAGSYLFARRNPDVGLPASAADRVPERIATVLASVRSRVGPPSPSAAEADTDGGTVRSPSDGATDSGDDESAAAETRLEFEEEIDDGIDPELLSDEERVLRLLKRNGGRMKQASIVTETGWSNAKVSQLLSQMDEDGEIEKLRIGRENLITLPEVDPTEVE